jgi:hypothetical protein
MIRIRELYIWIAGLLFVALVPPGIFDACILKFAGFWCPGCGLGHSIYYLVRGELSTSFQYNPMAIPALIIVSHRIYKLTNYIKL